MTKKEEFKVVLEAYVEIYFNDDMTPDASAVVSDTRTQRKRDCLEELHDLTCKFHMLAPFTPRRSTLG